MGGAPEYNRSAGAAYIFRSQEYVDQKITQVQNNGTMVDNSTTSSNKVSYQWMQWPQLSAPRASPFSRDQFGSSVSISGGQAVVGAPHAYVSGKDVWRTTQPYTWAGKIFLFQYIIDKNDWNKGDDIMAMDGLEGDLFGTSVAMGGTNGEFIVVGAEGKQQCAGAAYVLHQSGSGFTHPGFTFIGTIVVLSLFFMDRVAL